MPGSDVSRDAPQPPVAGGPWILPSVRLIGTIRVDVILFPDLANNTQNRRIRHLSAISLRNLSFTEPKAVRRPGVSVDDEALPLSRHSPAKLVNQEHLRSLEHSRSSTDPPTFSDHRKKAPGTAFATKMSRICRSSTAPASKSTPPAKYRIDWAHASSLLKADCDWRPQPRTDYSTFSFPCMSKMKRAPPTSARQWRKPWIPTSALSISSTSILVPRAATTLPIKVWAKPLAKKSFALLVEAEINLRYLQVYRKRSSNLTTSISRQTAWSFTL